MGILAAKLTSIVRTYICRNVQIFSEQNLNNYINSQRSKKKISVCEYTYLSSLRPKLYRTNLNII